MRTVLYTHDLIPITVLDLPKHALEILHERGSVRLATQPPIQTRYDPEAARVALQHLRIEIVTITAEPLVRGRAEAWMLFTRDEESALALKAAFLPGQAREVRDREATAFCAGIVHALGLSDQ